MTRPIMDLTADLRAALAEAGVSVEPIPAPEQITNRARPLNPEVWGWDREPGDEAKS